MSRIAACSGGNAGSSGTSAFESVGQARSHKERGEAEGDLHTLNSTRERRVPAQSLQHKKYLLGLAGFPIYYECCE